MIEFYPQIKHLHILTVLLSGALCGCRVRKPSLR